MKNFVLMGPGCSGTNLIFRCLTKTGLQRILLGRHPHTRIVPKNSREHADNCECGRCREQPSCNVLYIYADPRNILLCSVNRTEKASKRGLKCSDLWLWNHCNPIEGDREFVTQNAGNINIEHILNINYDPLKLEEHFTNWLAAPINYKLMMLKYEALANPKTYQEVLKFFDVKGDQEVWKPRRTDYLNLAVEQQVQITELFKNLLKKQAEIPPIYIRN